MILEIIYFLKIAITSLFLVEACKLDLKERRIPDTLWKKLLAIMLPLMAIELTIRVRGVEILPLFQILIVFSIAYLLFRSNAFGGADAKAFMLLAIIFPFYPKFACFPIAGDAWGMFALSTLTNTILIAPVYLIYLLILKSNPGPRFGRIDNKWFIGYCVDKDRVPAFHTIIAKDRTGKIWVTPQVPYMIFITAGFFTSVLIGNPIRGLI